MRETLIGTPWYRSRGAFSPCSHAFPSETRAGRYDRSTGCSAAEDIQRLPSTWTVSPLAPSGYVDREKLVQVHMPRDGRVQYRRHFPDAPSRQVGTLVEEFKGFER